MAALDMSCCVVQEEFRANKGKKIEDPFTRRSTKPRMVFKKDEHENPDGTPHVVLTEKVGAARNSKKYPSRQFIKIFVFTED